MTDDPTREQEPRGERWSDEQMEQWHQGMKELQARDSEEELDTKLRAAAVDYNKQFRDENFIQGLIMLRAIVLTTRLNGVLDT
jgi:hypothetical protein